MLKDICVCHFQLQRWKISSPPSQESFQQKTVIGFSAILYPFNYVKDRIPFIHSLYIVLVDIEHMLISPKSSFSSALRRSLSARKQFVFSGGFSRCAHRGSLPADADCAPRVGAGTCFRKRATLGQTGFEGGALHIRDEWSTKRKAFFPLSRDV